MKILFNFGAQIWLSFVVLSLVAWAELPPPSGPLKPSITVLGDGACPVTNDAVAISWKVVSTVITSTAYGDSHTHFVNLNVSYSACKDAQAGVWRLRVSSVEGNITQTLHVGGYRDPSVNPPTNQGEASDAVKEMKAYYNKGVGEWHTLGATTAHEDHHKAEFETIGDHYWGATEAAIESISVPLADYPNIGDATTGLNSAYNTKMEAFYSVFEQYHALLGDSPGDRPYAAGQLALNPTIQSVQSLAGTHGWNVPQGVNSPVSTPVCYQPWLPYSP